MSFFAFLLDQSVLNNEKPSKINTLDSIEINVKKCCKNRLFIYKFIHHGQGLVRMTLNFIGILF